jgi:hypothetical protein
MIKILVLMFILIGNIQAEDIDRYRNKDVVIPEAIKNSYKSYWQHVFAKNYSSISMGEGYDSQATLDNQIITHYAPSGDFIIKPIYFELLKKNKEVSTYLISADFLDERSALLKRATGCHFIRLEKKKVRFMSFIGDCLSD